MGIFGMKIGDKIKLKVNLTTEEFLLLAKGKIFPGVTYRVLHIEDFGYNVIQVRYYRHFEQYFYNIQYFDIIPTTVGFLIED
jgi:hypothetical protein